jgi:hypothetical protein
VVKPIIVPIIAKKRQREFSNNGRDYATQIESLQNKRRINFLYLIKRIEKGTRRINKFPNLSHREKLRRQALFVNKITARLTDAYLHNVYDIKKYSKMDEIKRNDIFEREFFNIFEKIIRPRIKDAHLLDTIEKTNLYFAIPTNIHNRRISHTKKLSSIRTNILKSKESLRKNLEQEMDKILSKRKIGETYKVKAMDVCVAASLYADILQKTKKLKWLDSYKDGMEIAYEKISIDEKLVEKIINLSKKNQ